MTPEQAAKHPIVEYAKFHLWDSGITTIPKRVEDELNELSKDDRQKVLAFFTAASVGCPVPVTLASDSKYGPKYQVERYTQTGFWYRQLEELLGDSMFGHPVDLTFLGGRGTQDEGWVPEGRKRYLSGPSTYEGYMLPRLIIDIISFADKYGLDVTAETFRVLDLVIVFADRPFSAIAFLVIYMRQIGFGIEHLSDRLYDEDFRNETPPEYWQPLFDHLSGLLPPELNYRRFQK